MSLIPVPEWDTIGSSFHSGIYRNETWSSPCSIPGVPLLGSDSDVSELYASKDGARLLFSESHVGHFLSLSHSLSHFLSLGQTHTRYFSYCLQSHTHIHFTRAIAIWPCNSNYGFLTFSYYHTSLSVKVATPPYVSDVVSEAQLVEQLTALMASYPLIRRWVFKLPRHTRGRGFGQFNMFVNNLFTSKHLCT